MLIRQRVRVQWSGGRQDRPTQPPRRAGVVLLAVLVVVVLLSLAAYHFSDFTMGEYQAIDQSHKLAQARALADSGIHYTAGVLADPDAMANVLGNQPYHNPTAFSQVAVPGDENKGLTGTFTLLAGGPDGNLRNGVIDETGKINLNAAMLRDPFGDDAYAMLMKLPNMTEDVAGSIVDWIDADNDPRSGGAENSYYSGLTPPYAAKNGPLESIEELLLVKGVTPDLLFGSDRNRNGVIDEDERGGDGTLGWSAFLTIYSRELNRDSTGQKLLDINSNASTLNDALPEIVGQDMTKFIILYRQYGPATSSGKRQSMGRSIASLALGGSSSNSKNSSSSSSTQPGNLADAEIDIKKSARTKIASLFDLVDAQVGVTKRTGKGKSAKSVTLLYTSPLKDSATARDLLTKLFLATTASRDTEIPARINVNTAPAEVIKALPGLTDSEAQDIVNARPALDSGVPPEDVFATPAWLLTEASIKPSTLSKLDSYITTRAQVFRIQAVGVLDSPGPTARVEAIVDTNAGRPRILAYRDLTELGR